MLDLLSMVPYYTAHLCAALAAASDFDVQLYSTRYEHDPDIFRRMGIANRCGLHNASRLMPPGSLLCRVVKAIEYLLNLTALGFRILLHPPDVLHVQFLPLLERGLPLEQWFLALAKWRGVRIVHTVHNVLPLDAGHAQRAGFGKVYTLADRLICHDDAAAARIANEFDVSPRRVDVIPHGLLFSPRSATGAAALRARLGLTDGEVLIVLQGILRPYKGVLTLLKAWEQVRDCVPSARLAIVGSADPDLARKIRRVCRELGPAAGIHLDLRFVPLDEVENYLEAADILVYPYLEATTSGALMTGIQRGKPIVATQLPAFTGVLAHEFNALLVPPGKEGALAYALSRLAASPWLRARLASELVATGRKYPTWTKIAEQTLACYQSATAIAEQVARHALAAGHAGRRLGA